MLALIDVAILGFLTKPPPFGIQDAQLPALLAAKLLTPKINLSLLTTSRKNTHLNLLRRIWTKISKSTIKKIPKTP